MNRSKLLAGLALGLMNVAFGAAIIHKAYDLRWVAAYIAFDLFYTALHFRRLRHLSEGLRRRIEKAAIALGAFLSALFFYNCAPGMPWWLVGATWLVLATAAYFLYGVLIFDDDEELAELVQVVVSA